jgi:uncharacterized protein YwqG
MELSLIKVIDGKLDDNARKLTLTVEYLHGQPKAGDGVFLSDRYFGVHFYLIEEVQEELPYKQSKLTLEFTENSVVWHGWIAEHLKDENTAFCGISIEDYHNLTTNDKVNYFNQISNLIGIGRVTRFLDTNLQLAIRLVLQEREANEEEEGEIGLTKFGGLPVATKYLSFPKGQNGRSALFICQIHIHEFNKWFKATKQFEGDGVLYFFGSIRQNNGYHSFDDLIVVYSDERESMGAVMLPEDIIEYGTFGEQDMMVIEEVNIPGSNCSLWEGAPLTDAERRSYYTIESIIEKYSFFKGPKLLGHPEQIQGCVLLETELKRLKKGWYNADDYDQEKWEEIIKQASPEARKWRLLLQISLNDDGDYFQQLSSFKGKFNEYNGGSYFLMVKQADLEQMKFSDCESMNQST